MAESRSCVQQHWLELLERKFQNYFVDPKDSSIQRWLATAERGVATKGHIHRGVVAHLLGRPLGRLRVLDAGCGTGDVTFAFAGAGARVVGIDNDPDFIQICELRRTELGQTNAIFVLADLSQGAPIGTEQFDVALSIDVIEHVQDPGQYLTVIYQMLKPGGYLYLLTGNKYALPNIQRDPHYKLAGVVLLPKSLARWYVCQMRRKVRHFDIEKMFSVGELRSLLHNSGFDDVSLSRLDAQDALRRRSSLDLWTKRLGWERQWQFTYEWFWAHTIKTWAARAE